MNTLTLQDKNMAAVESALVMNDLSKLSAQERMTYYDSICKSVGLNPMTRPFAFLQLQGKTVLYATKDCSEQLRKIHGVSTQIVRAEVVDDCFEVQIKVRDKSGREDEDFAAVPIGNAKGADLANIKMKTITKAKRRATLSICGLGILDETELETIPREVKGFAENPQIQSPFKKEEPQPEVETFDVDEKKLSDYVCKVGKKYAGKPLSEIDMFDLNNYLKWLKESSDKKGQSLSGDWLEFYESAEAYLFSLESKEVIR